MSISLNETVKIEFGELGSHYFNAAYLGPSPLRSKKAVELTLAKEVNPSFVSYHEWYDRPEVSRKLYADLLGVSAEEVFHSCSVSDVNNTIIHGLDLKEGDAISVINKDYPSNVLPYMLFEERRKTSTIEWETL